MLCAGVGCVYPYRASDSSNYFESTFLPEGASEAIPPGPVYDYDPVFAEPGPPCAPSIPDICRSSASSPTSAMYDSIAFEVRDAEILPAPVWKEVDSLAHREYPAYRDRRAWTHPRKENRPPAIGLPNPGMRDRIQPPPKPAQPPAATPTRPPARDGRRDPPGINRNDSPRPGLPPGAGKGPDRGDNRKPPARTGQPPALKIDTPRPRPDAIADRGGRPEARGNPAANGGHDRAHGAGDAPKDTPDNRQR